MFDPLTLNCNSIVNKFTVYMNSGQEPIIGSCSGSFFDNNNNNNNNLNIFMQDCCFSFKKKNCYQCRSCKKLKMKK